MSLLFFLFFFSKKRIKELKIYANKPSSYAQRYVLMATHN